MEKLFKDEFNVVIKNLQSNNGYGDYNNTKHFHPRLSVNNKIV